MRQNWKLFRVKVKVELSQGVIGVSSPGQPVSQSNSLLKQKGLVRDTPNSEFQRYVRALEPFTASFHKEIENGEWSWWT